MEVVSLNGFFPLPSGKDQYSHEFIENRSAILLQQDKVSVTVGICNPDDEELRDILNRYHNKSIVYRKLEQDDFAECLSKLYSGFDNSKMNHGKTEYSTLTLDKVEDDAPAINFVNNIVLEGIRKRASDIHLESYKKVFNVRYRIDGVLRMVRTINSSFYSAVSSRIKIISGLNIMEHRLPQDGRISFNLEKEVQDIRVSIVPTVTGESIVLRLLGRKSSIVSITSLGLNKANLASVQDILKIPSGMVVVSGPTGSGKTTTLNAIIRGFNRENLKIVTIEDPVEYLLQGINQVQINEEAGITFGSALKKVLRQDPDILMIGEIRDPDTAAMAVRAALTGHLVLTTLHTKNSVAVIDRLSNLGIAPFMIAAVLKISIAQRLIRTLCPYCRIERAPTAAEKIFLRKKGSVPVTVFDAAGCKKCSGTGYLGRIPIMEAFTADEDLEKIISQGTDRLKIQQHLCKKGMQFLIHEGIEKINKGVTSVSEIEGVVDLL